MEVGRTGETPLHIMYVGRKVGVLFYFRIMRVMIKSLAIDKMKGT